MIAMTVAPEFKTVGSRPPGKNFWESRLPEEGLGPRGDQAFEVRSLRPLSKLNHFGVKAGETEAHAESFSAYCSETVRFFFFFGGKAPCNK